MTSLGSSRVWMCRSTLIQSRSALGDEICMCGNFASRSRSLNSWSYSCSPATLELGEDRFPRSCSIGLRFRLRLRARVKIKVKAKGELPERAGCGRFSRIKTRNARVVEWQTRTFEGRMAKGMRVQVPPRALKFFPLAQTNHSRRG